MLHEGLRRNVLALAERLGAHQGLSVSSVFLKHVRDPKAAYRLQAGEDFKAKTCERWVQMLSNAWPDDLEWPQGSFARPAPLTAEQMAERDAAERAERAASRQGREEAAA